MLFLLQTWFYNYRMRTKRSDRFTSASNVQRSDHHHHSAPQLDEEPDDENSAQQTTTHPTDDYRCRSSQWPSNNCCSGNTRSEESRREDQQYPVRDVVQGDGQKSGSWNPPDQHYLDLMTHQQITGNQFLQSVDSSSYAARQSTMNLADASNLFTPWHRPSGPVRQSVEEFLYVPGASELDSNLNNQVFVSLDPGICGQNRMFHSIPQPRDQRIQPSPTFPSCAQCRGNQYIASSQHLPYYAGGPSVPFYRNTCASTYPPASIGSDGNAQFSHGIEFFDGL